MPISPEQVQAYRDARQALRAQRQAFNTAQRDFQTAQNEFSIVIEDILAGMAEGEAHVEGTAVFVKIDGELRRFDRPQP